VRKLELVYGCDRITKASDSRTREEHAVVTGGK
jgi:hypothetical protein